MLTTVDQRRDFVWTLLTCCTWQFAAGLEAVADGAVMNQAGSLIFVPPCSATGLEVRVAFGGVWKQSLTELSGGQRSLLALSLILAMLLFKPAPIYILDEVRPLIDTWS